MADEKPAVDVVPTIKVFAGNLAFATTDDTLKAHFSSASEVVAAHVVTRKNRSLGYGFVDFKTLESAEKAVRELHQKEFEGRTINVEVARPRVERPPRPERAERPERPERAERHHEEGGEPRRGGRRGGRGGRRGGSRGGYRSEEGGEAAPQVFHHEEGAEGEHRGRGRGRGRGGRGRRGGRGGYRAEGEGAEHHHEERGEHHEGGEPRRGGFRRGFRRPVHDEEGAEGEVPRPRGRGRGRGRAPRAPRVAPEDQTPSESTVFIANLPFSFDEERLMDLFKDFAPKQARVARFRGRSKGFGFVELDSKENQAKALAAIDTTEHEGRILSVKVAVVDLSAPPAEHGQAAQEQQQ